MTYTLRRPGAAPRTGLDASTPALLRPLDDAAAEGWRALLADGVRIDPEATALRSRPLLPVAVAYLRAAGGGVFEARDARGERVQDWRGGAMVNRATFGRAPSTLAAAFVGQVVAVEVSAGRWEVHTVASDGAAALVPELGTLAAVSAPAAVLREFSAAQIGHTSTLAGLRSTGEGGVVLGPVSTSTPIAVTSPVSTLGALVESLPGDGSALVAVQLAGASTAAPWSLVRWRW